MNTATRYTDNRHHGLVSVGLSNEDPPSESHPGDAEMLTWTWNSTGSAVGNETGKNVVRTERNSGISGTLASIFVRCESNFRPSSENR